jgi:type I restriction enzyme R subunit
MLSIPMAHQLIGFYTVPDGTDGVLKVMRSYQYYAANAISDKVAKTDWKSKKALGGHIWHTTGSGKTMTSFKSAQLIANSKDADKVIFLMDRIELGTQSLEEYRGFSDDNEDVQATENTTVLISKLKSNDPANTLIVTSIQKMSLINDKEEGLKTKDIEIMNDKRIVFIVDEAHRTTFGYMLIDIKATFPLAIFFGFTGTPIQDENQKNNNTTTSVFGDELHRYSIADGIRDKNVLGFDPYKVMTYKDKAIREAVALEKAKATSVKEVLEDATKKKIFLKYMNDVSMAGHVDKSGSYILGIEDHLTTTQYDRKQHITKVIEDIMDNWQVLSQGGKFHAMFATSSITMAILYYKTIKKVNPTLKITALFDPTIYNNGGSDNKEDALVEIIKDYNAQYDQDFKLATYAKMKKDIASRLSHKAPYLRIETEPEKQLDILIVVKQMLTGFDSKWVNTLYIDKEMQYENIIQAFSRTNRLFGPDKPHGTIRYYRKPHTMERNINAAIKLYSGDKPIGLFVEHLDSNLKAMNAFFDEIDQLFQFAGIKNFEKLPDDLTERGRFAKIFNVFNSFLEAARIQGFNWSKLEYTFGKGKSKKVIILALDEKVYITLVQRYKELFGTGAGSGGILDVPYEIEGHLTEIDTGKIDADYMNSRFEKYINKRDDKEVSDEELQQTLGELHKSFASLTKEEQKYANLFLHDVQRGVAQLESGKTLKDYIRLYQFNAKNDQILKIATVLGLDESHLRKMMDTGLTAKSINVYGRFKELKEKVNKKKAKAYFEEVEDTKLPQSKVNMKVDSLLRKFILEGGFEL